MMMTHRIVLKTHPLLTTHVRSVHSISFRSGLQTTKRPEGAHADAPSGTRGSRAKANRVRVRRVSFLFCAEVILRQRKFFDPRRELA
jgi:hypothetical protein